MIDEEGFFKGETCYISSGQLIWVMWNKDLALEFDFDVRITHFENKQVVLERRVSEPEIQFSVPKVGHYVVEVRVVDRATGEVGEWANPAVDETVGWGSDFTPSRWWLFAWIAPPTIGE